MEKIRQCQDFALHCALECCFDCIRSSIVFEYSCPDFSWSVHSSIPPDLAPVLGPTLILVYIIMDFISGAFPFTYCSHKHYARLNVANWDGVEVANEER